MGAGVTVLTLCVAYMAYMNATTENKHDTYMTYDEHGTLSDKRIRKSKWE